MPTVTEPTDVICKVTGTTICGSDLHLYHKEILQMQQGDILGHEWMGVVDEVGSEIKGVKKGDRVVASFQIAQVPKAYGEKTSLTFPGVAPVLTASKD